MTDSAQGQRAGCGLVANGLGGWIVVGVRGGHAVAGGNGAWQPPDGEIFIDQVHAVTPDRFRAA